MVRVLELFSGTRSVGKCCDALGWESVSVDMILPADHQCDIMDFDYKQYPKDTFDIVWASPPCTEYSAMNYCRPEKTPNIEGANKIVLKALEIINYFDCEYWFLENPQTGTLKKQPFMKSLNYHDIDYCMYNHCIRKRTRIWTNKKDWIGKLCDKTCGLIVDNKHPHFSYMNIKGVNRQHLRYRIPEDLIFSLFLD